MTKKYIIEVEEIPFEQQKPEVFANEGRIAGPRSNKKLFRAVGLPSLVFTEEDLEKLIPMEPEGTGLAENGVHSMGANDDHSSSETDD